ncbi:hypothetical protein JG687_00007598 [Phytophthora cactorum]|uniref:Uncharacterized protein n=1 Tax=Phytophthora cactorum TaxID=29920 RepID=A0A329RPG0_9STRA|nr:hypothetical protein Pcac1_g8892 [Phytophthora cactorum]KAG2818124.1 hypothetical protein PC111_g12424 [Phytophthora cactorum]KAG2833210.1 hypothetical protein PC112_g6581 [Phytophthora cactorum]KAG2853724.1 hypothetical protein PC113_g13929 [Phytophthora cactorum]KAG2893238.1 hypothetical protein PC114_g16337 [Phytophthora cactorum]
MALAVANSLEATAYELRDIFSVIAQVNDEIIDATNTAINPIAVLLYINRVIVKNPT